ncbi:MAG: hypothetical protein A2418_02345 [Candidatus Brennerbacteria bacterium RIFOXYC1_FULL_41_11]|nr:MAG: hypothetical protein A2418_02345 [Candidatus Brennerbacteria bacterium RIFOXYC1_FULL_41_11]
MKKQAFLAILLVGALILTGVIFEPEMSFADDVAVTASVSTSVSCSTTATSTAFGTLTTGSIATASPNSTLLMSCNYGAGCDLNINDAGGGGNPGLWNSSASDIVQSADATLSAGTEGYGIQAATTANGSGGVLYPSVNYWVTGDNVGGLTLGTSVLASSSVPISGREITVIHKAAISGLTAAGSYADTITYGCVGN